MTELLDRDLADTLNVLEPTFGGGTILIEVFPNDQPPAPVHERHCGGCGAWMLSFRPDRWPTCWRCGRDPDPDPDLMSTMVDTPAASELLDDELVDDEAVPWPDEPPPDEDQDEPEPPAHEEVTGAPAAASDLLAVGLLGLEHGLCMLPTDDDGGKVPRESWRRWQHRRPHPKQLAWWLRTGTGLGIVCGQISGGLEVLDFDALDDYDLYAAAAAEADLAELLARVEAGYCEQTPKGIHLLYRCDEISGNTKLARRPPTDAELAADPDTKIKVRIETRGEGGYIVIAPSYGAVHDTGLPYVLLAGGLSTIARITPAEREQLHAVARTLDELPQRQAQTPAQMAARRQAQGIERAGDEVRVGDDFNAKVDPLDLLEAAGWTVEHAGASSTMLTRPGKSRGVSAELHADGWLQVYTTSTEFDDHRQYDAFGIYAVLNHGGDITATVRDLAGQGYGGPREAAPIRPTDPATPEGWRRRFNAVVRRCQREKPAAEGGRPADLYAWAARVVEFIATESAGVADYRDRLPRIAVAMGLQEPGEAA